MKKIEPYILYQETLKEYETAAMVDMMSSIKMEFSEVKAEAYCSLGKSQQFPQYFKLVNCLS